MAKYSMCLHYSFQLKNAKKKASDKRQIKQAIDSDQPLSHSHFLLQQQNKRLIFSLSLSPLLLSTVHVIIFLLRVYSVSNVQQISDNNIITRIILAGHCVKQALYS